MCPFPLSCQYQYVPIFFFLSIPVWAHFLFPVNTSMCQFSVSCQYQYVPIFPFLSIPVCAHFLFPVNNSMCPLFSHTELQPFQNCCCFKFVFAKILFQRWERVINPSATHPDLRNYMQHLSTSLLPDPRVFAMRNWLCSLVHMMCHLTESSDFNDGRTAVCNTLFTKSEIDWLCALFLKCGAGECWRSSVGPFVRKMTKYYRSYSDTHTQ